MTGSSSLETSNTSAILSAAGGLLGKILKDVSPAEFWRRAFLASIVPFCGSILWHYARTVVEVTDGEQSLWIQMWLMSQQQRSALALRVRRLMLLSTASSKMGGGLQLQQYLRLGGRPVRHEDEEKEDGEEGRFAPPKFEFQPAGGVATWTWFGRWPVSLVNNHLADVGDEYYYGRRGGGVRGRSLYSITVWLAPSGTRVVRDILLQGRQLWLEKRAKKTEIWLCGGRYSSNNFKVVTRPSRPLSSVIVEGHTKETLRQDAIRFLGSEKWYVGKGIPYRRGFLLHGPPGCGKTSLVTALAGELRLPIVVIPLNSKELDDQMLMKMMGEAPKDSICLIEDIDCALPRGADQQGVTMARMTGRMPVTFSGLLNAIDGVGAQEGRLLFMTTNYLDRLDEALIRPGRVDVKFYLGMASRLAAGELFDQFFSSSSSTPSTMAMQEFSPKVIEQARSAFLANVEDGAHSFAALQGVLTTARDDPMLAEVGMQNLVASLEESVNGGKPPTTWETLASIESLSRGALEKEKKDEEEQSSSGSVVVKRLAGNVLEIEHNVKKRTLVISSFSTFGAPGKFAASGVLYYEVEIIKAYRGCPQFGFALKNGIEETKEMTDIGVGDNDKSWAVDGYRGLKWNGEAQTWNCSWKNGAVVGLAANVDSGMIAVSVDGSWGTEKDELGIVFQNDLIKEGVFPCFTASAYKLRYSFDKADLTHGPPPASIWRIPDGEATQLSLKS